MLQDKFWTLEKVALFVNISNSYGVSIENLENQRHLELEQFPLSWPCCVQAPTMTHTLLTTRLIPTVTPSPSPPNHLFSISCLFPLISWLLLLSTCLSLRLSITAYLRLYRYLHVCLSTFSFAPVSFVLLFAALTHRLLLHVTVITWCLLGNLLSECFLFPWDI